MYSNCYYYNNYYFITLNYLSGIFEAYTLHILRDREVRASIDFSIRVGLVESSFVETVARKGLTNFSF
jgi:hypothetical protein